MINAVQIQSKARFTYEILGKSFADQVIAIDASQDLPDEFEEAVATRGFLSARNVGLALLAVTAWVIVLAL